MSSNRHDDGTGAALIIGHALALLGVALLVTGLSEFAAVVLRWLA